MSTSATLFVRHKVTNYAAWRQVYDGAEAIRQQGGVTAASVHHDADEPDSVIVTHTFPNLDAARAFAGNPGLRDAMARAGVVGQPIFWFGVLAVA